MGIREDILFRVGVVLELIEGIITIVEIRKIISVEAGCWHENRSVIAFLLATYSS